MNDSAKIIFISDECHACGGSGTQPHDHDPHYCYSPGIGDDYLTCARSDGVEPCSTCKGKKTTVAAPDCKLMLGGDGRTVFVSVDGMGLFELGPRAKATPR
jgi:hypothetical protein